MQTTNSKQQTANNKQQTTKTIKKYKHPLPQIKRLRLYFVKDP
ncbi:hypothetical protein [Methanolapillus ohkumae]